MPILEWYSGEAGACANFLLQCSLVFNLQPLIYPSHRVKIAFVVNLLSGRVAPQRQKVSECLVRSLGNVSRQSEAPMEPSIPVPVPLQEALTDEPMQLGQTLLTHSECKRQLSTRVCLYCGHTGHFLAVFCPVQPKD